MFSGWERPSHWLVLAVVVVVLFGYKKLPDAARSVGRSLRIFKTEMKGMGEDDKAREAAKEAAEGKDAAASPPAVEAAPAPADAEGPAPAVETQPQNAPSSQGTPRTE